MEEIAKYSGCFVCGDKNDKGLNARFFYDGTKAITELVATEQFEGYRGIYHGGVLSTLLDEVMIKAILALDIYVVTAEITVRFVAPVRIGDNLSLTGWVTKQKRRVFHTEGRAVDQDGNLLATATAIYVEANPDLKTELMQSIQ